MTYVDIASRYLLGDRIATGGMGVVWRATDTVLQRQVAVKILKAEYADDPVFRARFEEEARHAAALHHPNVAAIFDVGEQQSSEAGSPTPFLVMELVDGQPLSALIRRGSPMDPAVATDLVVQAADGVAAAHGAGIVHRDLKPANLLVTPDRHVKITDFGIARAADGLALTHTGEVLGTPHYFAPEQATGLTATSASDVYSLGVVLFECLAGRRPFEGEGSVATALAHVREPVPALPETIPATLRAVVQRALAKEPTERYADAAAFASALRATGVESPAVAVPPTVVVEAAPPTQVLTTPPAPVAATPRKRRWWLLPVAALLLAGLYVGYVALTGEETPGPSDTPSTPVDTGFSLTRTDFVGHRLVAVTRALEARDLTVVANEVTNPDRRIPKIVSAVTPLTGLHAGDTVVVSYWGPRPTDNEQNPPHGNSGKGKGHKR